MGEKTLPGTVTICGEDVPDDDVPGMPKRPGRQPLRTGLGCRGVSRVAVISNLSQNSHGQNRYTPHAIHKMIQVSGGRIEFFHFVFQPL